MGDIFAAYDIGIEQLVEFYQRLNQPITYPDGMTTTLGIIYWGRDEHLAEIEKSIPKLVANGLTCFSAVLQAIKTPASANKLSERAGIPPAVLRILKHDIEMWLPQVVPLIRHEWLRNRPELLNTLSRVGLDDQLAVISAGQTPEQRQRLAQQTGLQAGTVDEMVRLCDFYRTGKNLEHIRAKIYYAMGMDTWQKWAAGTSEGIISRFAQYVQENGLEGERLVPWPKEVRNGIEWAKLHLEIFTVEW
jgi:hypothetical protein